MSIDSNNIEMDILIETEPFSNGEESIINIMSLIDKKYIRRFGAVLNHNNIGYNYNSMLVWKIAEDKIDKAGAALEKYPIISHCYRREPKPGWSYNLYAMIHTRSEPDYKKTVKLIRSEINGIEPNNEFLELKTIKEFKKASFNPYNNSPIAI